MTQNDTKLEQAIDILNYHKSKGDIDLIGWKRDETTDKILIQYTFSIPKINNEEDVFNTIQSVDMDFLNLAKGE